MRTLSFRMKIILQDGAPFPEKGKVAGRHRAWSLGHS